MSAPCFVYVIGLIRDGEICAPVKVGISNDVNARLKQLQTGTPYPMAVIHQFWIPSRAAAKEIEFCFHDMQKRHRTHGEWFDMEPETAMELAAMAINSYMKCVLKLSDEKRLMAWKNIGHPFIERGVQ